MGERLIKWKFCLISVNTMLRENLSLTSGVKSLARNWRYCFSPRRKIGYLGWLGHNNLGDEAMYRVATKIFHDFEVLPFKDTPKMRLYEQLTNKRIFDAIMVGGGTLINSNGWLSKVEKAFNKNKKTFLLGVGVRNPAFWSSKGEKSCIPEWIDLLSQCKFVGVRGPLSLKSLEECNFFGAEITGDQVLSLTNEKIIKKKEGIKKIGINIGMTREKAWSSDEHVLDIVVRSVNVFIEKGWKVEFLPVWDQDINLIEEAVRRINKPVPIFKGFLSLEKTIRFLESCSIFIGEKLHSVILAMTTATPSIMLEYRPKCLDFMLSMDLEEFNIRIDKLSLDLLIETMEKVVYQQNDLSEKIFQKATYYKNIQREKCDLIREMILQS